MKDYAERFKISNIWKLKGKGGCIMLLLARVAADVYQQGWNQNYYMLELQNIICNHGLEHVRTHVLLLWVWQQNFWMPNLQEH